MDTAYWRENACPKERDGIIWLEARLQPNIGNALRPAFTVFTCSGITPPKVNRFGWNLEHSEYIVRGWPGRFGCDPRSSESWTAKQKLFLSGKQRTILPVSSSAKFHEIWTQHVDRCRDESVGTKF